MRRPTTKIAALATTALLAAAPAAIAQGAADEQYRDPFAGQNDGDTPSEQPAEEPAPTGGEAPAPTAPAPTTTAPAPTTGAEPVATTAGELPRTGLPAIGTVALGVVMLAGGFALRRRAD
ncbi:MAG TPA: LPXTG cell wall anchor domain-containing protein [Thermoleophilaceae bacterium]|nr:LPXTG cell wall anchor domain-containing protein [Thermoleophilaceae bacterium]